MKLNQNKKGIPELKTLNGKSEILLVSNKLKCKFCLHEKYDLEGTTTVAWGTILHPIGGFDYEIKTNTLSPMNISGKYAVVDCPSVGCSKILADDPDGAEIYSLLVKIPEDSTSEKLDYNTNYPCNTGFNVTKIEQNYPIYINNLTEKGTLICTPCGHCDKVNFPKSIASITYNLLTPKGIKEYYWPYIKIECPQHSCLRTYHIPKENKIKSIIALKESKIIKALNITTESLENLETYNSKEFMNKLLQVLAEQIQSEENQRLNRLANYLERIVGNSFVNIIVPEDKNE